MEKRFQVFKLHFQSGLHIGKGKSHYAESDHVLHSDTIAAALHVAARHLWEYKADVFSQNILISSAFPFYGDELFFPKPFIKLPDLGSLKNDGTDTKKFKRIQYLGKDYFEKLLNNPLESWPDAHISFGGSFISNQHNDQPLYASGLQERVHIPGEALDSVPYTLERLHFRPDAGLYFMASMPTEFLKEMEQCLEWLGDQGIGTDRSVGNGHFNFTSSEVTFRLPESENAVLLSLYSPSAPEYSVKDFLESARYQLIRRGGYISSPSDETLNTLQKKSVYMFGEGSVFPNYKQRIGEIKNLKPEERINHPIWRDGRAFFLPCVISDEHE